MTGRSGPRSRQQGSSVQSCLTNVSFPETLAQLHDTIDSNAKYGADIYLTDLDILLTQSSSSGWTSAKWLTTGDILFFYCTKSAASRQKAILL